MRHAGLPLEVVEDLRFLVDAAGFNKWLARRRQPRLEHFYRAMRRQTGILMRDGEPLGGRWNFDASNRGALGRQGPVHLPPPPAFPPDRLTREVIRLANREFPDHPGTPDTFDWPVTPVDAQYALEEFITHRLTSIGNYQDAMWAGEPLYHSLPSPGLNLKLLDPREVLRAADDALRGGAVPLAGVEGFVRQILGWRKYVRGIYRARMPGYASVNVLGAGKDLPAFFWNGHTDMACLREVIGQTLRHGYAHHIQRLMVTGLYCLLLGVQPQAVHAW